jgi:NAD(P)-dependent dehydrogenase (short-subunit alcohol dehydrogenase family)
MAALAMVGRIGTPEDIAHATSFLCAEESSFITAQTLSSSVHAPSIAVESHRGT